MSINIATGNRKIMGYYLEYIFADFVAYAACYIVYIAVYLALVAILYKRFWKKAQKECEDPIIQ